MLTPAKPASEQLPLLTRCLVARVRLAALGAQLDAGGPARPGQLERALELLADHQADPPSSTTCSAIAPDRQRPGRTPGESHSARRCSSQKDDELTAEEHPKQDKKRSCPRFSDILPREKKRR